MPASPSTVAGSGPAIDSSLAARPDHLQRAPGPTGHRAAILEGMSRKPAVPPAPSDPTIDALYGLDPVFEPGADSRAVSPLEFVMIRCPHCGERYDTPIDLTAGAYTSIEDCQVCCQPIEVTVSVTDAGALRSVRVARLD